MATYVLIHGSFQGGWIWKPVADRLQAAGHAVYRPTLDGCAELSHTIRPEITLDTQGKQVADLLSYEDLTGVVMAGTSSGGMVVARAAELAPDRIRRLVFIDALVPVPGETVSTVNGRPAYDPKQLTYGLKPEEVEAKAFADLPADIRPWAVARYTRHPRNPTEEAVDLQDFWSRKWQVDVVNCVRSEHPPAVHQQRTAGRLGGTYKEIDTGHYPMLSHPDLIAGLFVAMA